MQSGALSKEIQPPHCAGAAGGSEPLKKQWDFNDFEVHANEPDLIFEENNGNFNFGLAGGARGRSAPFAGNGKRHINTRYRLF